MQKRSTFLFIVIIAVVAISTISFLLFSKNGQSENSKENVSSTPSPQISRIANNSVSTDCSNVISENELNEFTSLIYTKTTSDTSGSNRVLSCTFSTTQGKGEKLVEVSVDNNSKSIYMNKKQSTKYFIPGENLGDDSYFTKTTSSDLPLWTLNVLKGEKYYQISIPGYKDDDIMKSKLTDIMNKLLTNF